MVDNINCRGLVLSSWHRMHKNAGEPLLSESITFELVISFGGGWECLDVSTESKKVSSNFSAGAGMVCAGEQGSYLEGFSHLLGMDCLKRNEQIGLKENSCQWRKIYFFIFFLAMNIL